MMLAANVPILERGKVAIEAIKNATQLDGLRVVTINNVTQTRDKHMFGSLSRWTKSLRTWDEAGVVKEGKHGKTGDRGIRMMLWVTPTIVQMTAAACGRKRPITSSNRVTLFGLVNFISSLSTQLTLCWNHTKMNSSATTHRMNGPTRSLLFPISLAKLRLLTQWIKRLKRLKHHGLLLFLHQTLQFNPQNHKIRSSSQACRQNEPRRH